MTKTMKDALLGSEVAVSETSQQGRGREEQPEGRTTRAKSRDILASMEARLARVEEGASNMEARLDDMDQRIDGLEAEDAELQGAVRESLNKLEASYRKDLEELRAELTAEVGRVRDVYERQINNVLAQLEEARTDVIMCKKALAAGPATTSVSTGAHRVEVPKPRSYAGARNAREVDNFLWGLEQYLGATGVVEDDAKVQTAELYLSDTAMLWWRRRQEDIRRGTCTIKTFEEFKAELKRQL